MEELQDGGIGIKVDGTFLLRLYVDLELREGKTVTLSVYGCREGQVDISVLIDSKQLSI